MEIKNNNAPLTASKDFAIAVDILYRAWTEPDQLKQWWKPMGNQLTEVNSDLKEGGEIKYTFKTGGSEDLVIRGKYLEVVPDQKLVYTWKWQVPDKSLNDSEFQLTINFKPSDKGSSIQISQEENNPQESIKPHQHGWDKALNHLSEFLESNKNYGDEQTSTDSHAEQSGVSDYGGQDPAGV